MREGVRKREAEAFSSADREQCRSQIVWLPGAGPLLAVVAAGGEQRCRP